MLRPIDNWYLQQDEPAKSCLQFLRDHILKLDKQVTESWKYQMPFFHYGGKRFCYLWVQKKDGWPYIGFVNGKDMHHPGLLAGDRSRMKILLIDPHKNIPVRKIDAILKEAIKGCP